MRFRSLVAVLVLMSSAACGRDSESGSPTGPSPTPSSPTLTIQGDPASTQGATWTYVGSVAGVVYDLQGILLKPQGSGPFPAVVISHGAGGNATAYSRGVATEMVRWGVVCIGTNYTHAGGVPIGAPGTALEPGASQANVFRAHAAYDILRRLGYVDMGRVAAHGHSMGAFVTTALIATYPTDFRVASHTAGGVRPDSIVIAAAPSESQGRSIRTPYQLHHGDIDSVVPIEFDRRLDAILLSVGTAHELYVYNGAEHNDVSNNPTVLGRIRTWYSSHGLF
jgi:dienelactone hydrolase